eukprot:CAMPEP_0179087826 /NCGR_PEP_ID=MMETSP0796-20121207/39924_1 /TAXON_ID=73915 /ORGANISM="Pyrodinium bahamense, Strain pbaha01" /LENGTH=199 /DNA_ID=CAMNT_0020785337 /DNA_START=141 /DNA_END=740 /DNA_ORIENTATION=+
MSGCRALAQTSNGPASFHSLAAVPFTLSLFAIRLPENSSPVLLPTFPLAIVLAAIGPCQNPMALHRVLPVAALVSSPVNPSENTGAMHLVVLPLANERASVGPLVCALAVEDTDDKLALVEFLELGAVRPHLAGPTVPLARFPLPLIPDAVGAEVGALAVGLVGPHVALVNVTVGVLKPPHSMGLVILPLAHVLRTIRP